MKTLEFVIGIQFVDRPGLGYNIFERFEANNIDKISMEVAPELGMMIQFRCSAQQEAEYLVNDLKAVEGVLAVSFHDHMPHKDREHELRTILNSVSEGIVAVNREHKVTHMNEVASRIFQIKRKEVIGFDVELLFEANPPILETLKTGIAYSLKERKIWKNNKLIHVLTSGVPIFNEKGTIIGGVVTIKDFRQVEEIISKVERKNRSVTFEQIVHQSQRMRQLVETAKTVARGSSTILLRGESGTGKEMFAKAIHMESPRYKSPFIAINCAALPDTLLESELFGYEEGAFTGAVKGGKKGLFEQSSGGTLFLDEIGEISPTVQVRLLRVLQEASIRRVGGVKEIPVDVRIIAATHRQLEQMIGNGQFREDLYYRLNVIPLKIPALRERPEDIPLIANVLIRKLAQKLGKSEIYLTEESMDLLMSQQWPGNVRELENTLERIINIIDTNVITPNHFSEWTDLTPAKLPLKHENDSILIEVPVSDQNWPTLKEIVSEVEHQVLLKVLEKNHSSRKAGNILGVSNTTILNKMKMYGISSKQ